MSDKKLHTIEFKLKKILSWGLFGNYKSKFSGVWMEFDEHKDYNSGDNIRDIDWKASSKTGELFIKKYEQEKDLKVLFVLDNWETMNFGSEDKTKLETLTEAFYTLALSAYYNNDNVWAIIWDKNSLEFLDYKKSKNNIYRIIDLLEKENTVFDLEKSFDKIKTKRIKNNLVFILTDKTEFDLKKIKFLNQNNDIIFINIFDKFENELNLDFWNLSFNLWNKFLNIDLTNSEKTKEFKKLRENKIKKLKYDLEKNNIWYIFLDNKSDILKELINYFWIYS